MPKGHADDRSESSAVEIVRTRAMTGYRISPASYRRDHEYGKKAIAKGWIPRNPCGIERRRRGGHGGS